MSNKTKMEQIIQGLIDNLATATYHMEWLEVTKDGYTLYIANDGAGPRFRVDTNKWGEMVYNIIEINDPNNEDIDITADYEEQIGIALSKL